MAVWRHSGDMPAREICIAERKLALISEAPEMAATKRSPSLLYVNRSEKKKKKKKKKKNGSAA